MYNIVIQHLYTVQSDHQSTLVTFCHHAKSLCYWLYSHAVEYIPVTYLFYIWNFIPLNPLHLLHLSPTSPGTCLFLGGIKYRIHKNMNSPVSSLKKLIKTNYMHVFAFYVSCK